MVKYTAYKKYYKILFLEFLRVNILLLTSLLNAESGFGLDSHEVFKE